MGKCLTFTQNSQSREFLLDFAEQSKMWRTLTP